MKFPVEHIARVAHETNRAYCQIYGDWSQPTWDEAPEWQQESARIGVQQILDGAIDSPEESHRSWLAVKEEAGWTYGQIKDPEAKKHPCMVPYDQLPEGQKVKDRLFFAVVRALMEGP